MPNSLDVDAGSTAAGPGSHHQAVATRTRAGGDHHEGRGAFTGRRQIYRGH